MVVQDPVRRAGDCDRGGDAFAFEDHLIARVEPCRGIAPVGDEHAGDLLDLPGKKADKSKSGVKRKYRHAVGGPFKVKLHFGGPVEPNPIQLQR